MSSGAADVSQLRRTKPTKTPFNKIFAPNDQRDILLDISDLEPPKSSQNGRPNFTEKLTQDSESFGWKRPLNCFQPSALSICPDGHRPQTVWRWFRHKNEEECRIYQYFYCSQEIEDKDRPIKFEEDCYISCFSDEEKKTLKVFEKFQFRHGFRIRN